MSTALETLRGIRSGAISIPPYPNDEIDRTDRIGQGNPAHSASVPSEDDLADLRAGLARLSEYAVRLRCEDPPKGTRAQALTYQAQQIEKLAALSASVGGTANGWPDPGDPFAYGDQITGLRVDLSDLTREDAPYPLGPLTDDPFSADPPRYYSGQVIGGNV